MHGKKSKKLQLNRETIRQLQDDELNRVVGGTIIGLTFICGGQTDPNQPGCDCLGTSLPAPTFNCQ